MQKSSVENNNLNEALSYCDSESETALLNMQIAKKYEKEGQIEKAAR